MTIDQIEVADRIRVTAANTPQDNFAADVRKGLTSDPKHLYPKYLYDQRGSELFEQICELPEYYQTRTERELLEQHSNTIVGKHGSTALVEYGAGAATKTRIVLDAMQAAGDLRHYVPIDVSADFLEKSARRLAGEYPELRIQGLTGDFLQPVELPFPGEPRLIAFLGSTIGNLNDRQANRFFHLITDQMNANDLFLLGVDLVKDISTVEAAYNDSRGVTAEFDKNILRIINRELDGNFQLDSFQHHAFYNPRERQIEIHLVSMHEQLVRIDDLDLEVEFEQGESILVEISSKYTRKRVRKLLAGAGLTQLGWFSDSRGYFALSLSTLEEHTDGRHHQWFSTDR